MKFLFAIPGVVVSLASFQQTLAHSDAKKENTGHERRPQPPKPTNANNGGNLGYILVGIVFRPGMRSPGGIKPKEEFSLDSKMNHEHLKDKWYNQDPNYYNCGASLFARFRLAPKAYVHAEFAQKNFGHPSKGICVTFLLVAGGKARPLAPERSGCLRGRVGTEDQPRCGRGEQT